MVFDLLQKTVLNLRLDDSGFARQKRHRESDAFFWFQYPASGKRLHATVKANYQALWYYTYQCRKRQEGACNWIKEFAEMLKGKSINAASGKRVHATSFNRLQNKVESINAASGKRVHATIAQVGKLNPAEVYQCRKRQEGACNAKDLLGEVGLLYQCRKRQEGVCNTPLHSSAGGVKGINAASGKRLHATKTPCGFCGRHGCINAASGKRLHATIRTRRSARAVP